VATSAGISRRRFIGVGVVTAGAVAVGGVRALTARAASTNPLHIPPRVSLTSATSRTLAARESTWDLGGGRQSPVWAFNRRVPGPTYQINAGEEAIIQFRNRLAHHSIVHWHGLEVDEANDGGPRLAVAGGRNYSYAFPVHQRASMSWYHPHPHMHTAEQAYMGLYGAFIIRDTEELGKKLPRGKRELPLVICDATLGSAGELIYKPSSSGLQGKLPLVNGTLDAYVDVEPAVYRLRILNGANARVFKLASSGGSFILIGNDGGLLPHAVPGVSEIELSPGERVDVLVDLRGLAGQKVLLQCRSARWTLLELRVADAAPVQNMPALPTSNVPALLAPSTVTRTFSFDGMSRINGQIYDMERLDFSVPAGTVERWQFTTGGNAPHPVHIHGTHFQVLDRSGGRGRMFPWEAGWKDTVLLQKGETVDVAVRFDSRFTGSWYLLHCHQLQHEDAGMMMNFKVV
jgi:blue copper oxidase